MKKSSKVGVVGAGMMGAENALCFAIAGYEVATPEDIDTACKLGLFHPIGPYALMDLTSNDLNLKVQEILFATYGKRYRSRPILK